MAAIMATGASTSDPSLLTCGCTSQASTASSSGLLISSSLALPSRPSLAKATPSAAWSPSGLLGGRHHGSSLVPFAPGKLGSGLQGFSQQKLSSQRRGLEVVAARSLWDFWDSDFTSDMQAIQDRMQQIENELANQKQLAFERAKRAQERALQSPDAQVRSLESRNGDKFSSYIETERYQNSPYTTYEYTSDRVNMNRSSYSRSYTSISYSVYSSTAPAPVPQPTFATAAGGIPGAIGVTLAVLAAVYAAIAVRFVQGFRFTKFLAAERLKLALMWPHLAIFSKDFRVELLRAISRGRLARTDTEGSKSLPSSKN